MTSLAQYEYEDFLESKKPRSHAVGFDVPLSAFNSRMSGMFEYEAHVTRWAIHKGRAAIFAGCGMGKTAMQCEWARFVSEHDQRPVLVYAPLVVADQTVRDMADDFHIKVTPCESMADVRPGINITNYEKLDKFSADAFCGVVLDESSILKAHTGKYRQQLTEWAQPLQYRLCCTATPSPNDHVELATHAEFLGVMRREEMLATFFVHDGGKTSDWRLKGHAQDEFWKWVSTWALAFQKPSDIGFSDEGFTLPPLTVNVITVESPTLDGYLFPVEAVGLSEQREAKRKSIPERVIKLRDLILGNKLSVCPIGNQNTNEAASKRSYLIPPTPSDSVNSNSEPEASHPGRNTSENGTPQTVSMSSPIGDGTQTSRTLLGEKNTEAIQNISASKSGPSRSGKRTIPKRDLVKDSSDTGSPLNSTVPCLNRNATNALSVDHPLAQSSTEKIFTSITATLPTGSVDSCVQTAILALENLKTIPPYSTEQENTYSERWLIACQLNDEQDAIEEVLGDSAASICGSLSLEEKRSRMIQFLDGKKQHLVGKGRMVGYGLNLQFINKIALAGIDHSWETLFQLIRRCWRFGQKHPVNVYAFMSEAERGIWDNLMRKEKQAEEMMKGMVMHMEAEMRRELSFESTEDRTVKTDMVRTDNWTLGLGDCVQLVREIPDESVHFSVFSPPFASLYTYSALDEDMGNCRTPEQFAEHMNFLVPEIFRILKAGRLVSFHCMNLPTSKERDGYIGLKDFRGDLIRMFERRGFIYHSEVCIWKDPVTAMQRTKALGLLHKQVRKDSCMSRQGIPDYLVTMRKPGKNDEAVAGLLEYFAGDMNDEEFDVACREAFANQLRPTDREAMTYEVFKSIFIWQRYASPVWMDINPSDTLQKESARSERDERHIAPLQLQVIERAIQLWTNVGDVIFSPFAGIGSEGHVALKKGRQFIGFELKESYFKAARRNLEYAERMSASQGGLFDAVKVSLNDSEIAEIDEELLASRRNRLGILPVESD